jgi:hypothetical protein
MTSLINMHGPEAGAEGAPVVRDLRDASGKAPTASRRRAAAGGQ